MELYGQRLFFAHGVHQTVQTVDDYNAPSTFFDAAANAVEERIGALEARAADMMALRDASVTPAGYLVAFDYLLATTHAELSWLHGFAGSTRSDRPRRLTTDEVGI